MDEPTRLVSCLAPLASEYPRALHHDIDPWYSNPCGLCFQEIVHGFSSAWSVLSIQPSKYGRGSLVDLLSLWKEMSRKFLVDVTISVTGEGDELPCSSHFVDNAHHTQFTQTWRSINILFGPDVIMSPSIRGLLGRLALQSWKSLDTFHLTVAPEAELESSRFDIGLSSYPGLRNLVFKGCLLELKSHSPSLLSNLVNLEINNPRVSLDYIVLSARLFLPTLETLKMDITQTVFIYLTGLPVRLCTLPRLHKLYVTASAHLKYLRVPSLKTLEVVRLQSPEAGAGALIFELNALILRSNNPPLHTLHLTDIDEAAFHSLTNLPFLETLHLLHCDIVDSTLDILTDVSIFPRLQDLKFTGCRSLRNPLEEVIKARNFKGSEHPIRYLGITSCPLFLETWANTLRDLDLSLTIGTSISFYIDTVHSKPFGSISYAIDKLMFKMLVGPQECAECMLYALFHGEKSVFFRDLQGEIIASHV